MSLSKRLKASGEQRQGNNQYIEPLIPPRPLYGVANAGVYVDADSALRISTVYSCVRLLGDTVSSLPMGAYVRRGRNRISYSAVYGSQPEWINKPNPESTRLEFIEQIITSLHLHGNAYVLTVRDDMGEVVELYCLNPNDVKIERPFPGEPLVYKLRDELNNFTRILTNKEIVHIPMMKVPGSHYGLSPIGACRMSVGISMASDTYASSYFGNAANPAGVIEVAGELTDQQADDIKRQWNQNHGGPYMSGSTAILSGGAAFKPLSLNAADAQLIESRKFNVEDIARIFRVPLSLLGHKGLREGFLSLNDVRSFEDLSPLGEPGDQYRLPLQNIDAAQAPLVGDKMKAEIASILVQAGYNPDDVAKTLGMEEIGHTGLPSAQLQQVALIDPTDPESVYGVKE